MNNADRFRRLTAAGVVSGGLSQQTVRAGSFTFSAEVADFVLRMTSLAVLSRMLTPEDFGLLAMVTAITTIAEQFKDLGLTAATVQRKEITHEQISTLFWVNLGVGFGLMCLVAAVSIPLARFYSEPRLVPICLAIATSFLWSGASVQHAALLRRTMRFGSLAAIDTGSSVASIAVAVIMAMNGYGYWSLVVRELVRNGLRAVGAWAFLPWVPGAPSQRQGARSMLTFAGNVTGFSILRFTSASVGQMLVGRVFGAEALGVYRQAFQLVLVPIQHLSGPLRSVGDVTLSRLQGDVVRYRRFYQRFLALTSIATMPMMTLAFMLADEGVRFVLGPRWGQAAPLLRVTALASFLAPSITTAVAVALSCGHARRLLRFAVWESVGLAVFFFVGIPWGPLGVASAHLWVVCVVGIPAVYWFLKDTPISLRFFVSIVARPATASACMAGVLLAYKAVVPATGLYSVVSGAVLGVLVYALVLLLLPGGRAEVAGLVADLRRGVAAGKRPIESAGASAGQ
jgi:O-antigen/teichoic acid export membrane protein